MPKLWRNGRWERVLSIERGRMLVHSEAEWRELAKMRIFLFGVLIAFSQLFAFGLDAGDRSPLFLLIGLPLSLVAYLLGAFIWGGWHLWTGGSLPGVYERGVEVPWGRFVPNEEIMDVGRGFALQKKVLVLRLRPSGKKVALEWMIFGVDGSDHVESTLRGTLPAGDGQGRPRLVVYPTGAVAEGWPEQGPDGRMQY